VLTQTDINPIVKLALDEDIGSGDITAALVPSRDAAHATVITAGGWGLVRDTVCGRGFLRGRPGR
jgi:nicotinate-nucleotide pyrophosphorylase